MLSRLKQLRRERGLSQRALADLLGISQQSVNKYENHNIEPDIELLCQIADVFDVSIDYLVGRSDDQNHQYVSLESDGSMPVISVGEADWYATTANCQTPNDRASIWSSATIWQIVRNEPCIASGICGRVASLYTF